MSKKLINPQGRIKILSAAQKRAKSVFKKDEVLSARPMCEVLSVSWGTLKNWCEEIEGFEASGAFTRGGEGIKWNFKVHETIEYLLAWAKSQLRQRKRRSRSGFLNWLEYRKRIYRPPLILMIYRNQSAFNESFSRKKLLKANCATLT